MRAMGAPGAGPPQPLGSARRRALLEDLQRGRRAAMAVRVQTTMCCQKFLNAGVMSREQHEELRALAGALAPPGPRGRTRAPLALFVSATELGGGVAEMRQDTIALFRDLGIKADWLVMDGAELFYKTTVHIHEGIQNPSYEPLAPDEVETFEIVTLANFMRLEEEYILKEVGTLWLDDPQPLAMAPLIRALYPHIFVIWRCHVHVDPEMTIKSLIQDLILGTLRPDRDYVLLDFLKSRGYVGPIPRLHLQAFHQQTFANNLGAFEACPAYVMLPCINPLSFKNMDVNDALIEATLLKYGIMEPGTGSGRTVPPFVLQVSRFDPYKGPMELITGFVEAVTRMPVGLQREVRLVLVSSTPGDNPSGTRMSRLLQEFVDSLDLSALPEFMGSGMPKDLRKRIFLLTMDDKAPWERLMERIEVESGFDPDRLACVMQEVCHLAALSIPEVVASLDRCGIIPPELATRLLKPPLPSGVVFTSEQKDAVLCVLRSAYERRHPGGSMVTRHRTEMQALNGKEINAFEVNALQSSAIVTTQFSSKEGFGLVVTEAMVKSLPGHEGTMVATLVGGITPQAEICECMKIEYPADEVSASLQTYQALPDHPNEDYWHQLYSSIASRSSVSQLVDHLLRGVTMPEAERVRMSQSARTGVLQKFSPWVNVRNILHAMTLAANN